MLTLLITPLRRWLIYGFKLFKNIPWGKRISDWNVLIRVRKTLGLFSFFYAVLHAWVYWDLELSFSWAELNYEIQTRRFIIFGIISILLLFVLAATSPKLVQKRLKSWWRKIHRLTYVISFFILAHYFLAVKTTDLTPYYYLGATFILLAHRIVVSNYAGMRKKDDTGMETYRD